MARTGKTTAVSLNRVIVIVLDWLLQGKASSSSASRACSSEKCLPESQISWPLRPCIRKTAPCIYKRARLFRPSAIAMFRQLCQTCSHLTVRISLEILPTELNMFVNPKGETGPRFVKIVEQCSP